MSKEKKEVDIYMEEHKQILHAKYPKQRFVEKLQAAKFCTWFRDRLCDFPKIDLNLSALARGPTW